MPGTPVLINYLKSEIFGLRPVSWGYKPWNPDNTAVASSMPAPQT